MSRTHARALLRPLQGELDEQFDLHGDLLRDELAAAGVPEDQIDDRVRERFGDRDRYARACVRIVNKEQIIMQRINFALLLVIASAAVWMACTGRQAVERTPANAAHARPPTGVVYVDGSVSNPGTYAVPADGILSVVRVLTAAGTTPCVPETRRVVVRRTGPDGALATVFDRPLAELLNPGADGKSPDAPLRANDVISVMFPPAPTAGVVYLMGSGARGGSYAIPATGTLSVQRLLAAADFSPRPDDDRRVTVQRSVDGELKTVFSEPVSQVISRLPGVTIQDAPLYADDIVEVR